MPRLQGRHILPVRPTQLRQRQDGVHLLQGQSKLHRPAPHDSSGGSADAPAGTREVPIACPSAPLPRVTPTHSGSSDVLTSSCTGSCGGAGRPARLASTAASSAARTPPGASGASSAVSSAVLLLLLLLRVLLLLTLLFLSRWYIPERRWQKRLHHVPARALAERQGQDRVHQLPSW